MKCAGTLAAGLAMLSWHQPGVSQPASAAPTVDQQVAVATSLLASNSYAIKLEGGRITGPGGELILALAEQAQFVAIGEEHNNADIPQFLTALLRALHERAGYNYLAIEQDPATMRAISAPPLRGDLEAIRTHARDRKHSFTFNTDEELEMLAAAGQISTGRGRPVWGCEQVFGATHVLERILPHAPSPEAQALAARLLAEARRRESRRDDELKDRFLLDADAAVQVNELRRLYASATDAEVRFLVDALAKSFEIYGYYRNGREGLTPGFYSNNAVREEHMKSLCRDEYLRAQQLDGQLPRAILKFGHWHLYQGTSPASLTSTTGNFFANLAKLNELGFLSIAFMSRQYDGKPLWDGEDAAAYAALAPALDQPGWRLVDLRPLREYPVFRALLRLAGDDLSKRAEDNLKRLVYGFDFALIMDESRRGRFTAGQRDGSAP